MKEIERLYQLVTPFQANVWSLPQAAKAVLQTVLNVYTDGLGGSWFVTKYFLVC